MRAKNSYDDDEMFNEFVKVVNSQSAFNNDGEINAIPIVTYHNIDNNKKGDYITSIDLFDREMKYLHDNGFMVFDMADLGYDDNSNHLYIK
ncbi:MAG: hypothetical protein M3250_10380 [Thermoproteota archaeon]|nr:hypothetical protein [Thermoproteota archaeon]